MGKSAFIDEVEISARGGKGGDGVVSFLRERARPRGGPDGGDGGKGGDVWLRASLAMNTLLAHRRLRDVRAANGKHGSGGKRTGGDGEDVVVGAPVGTQILDSATGAVHGDLLRPRQRVLLAGGGRGGRGNAGFKTSVNRAPRRRTNGETGEERRFKLVLRLLANVGLVGMPNAGKSTLLAAVSAARPKIADYPFTTLSPQLGFVADEFGEGVTVADLPGLIRGAAEGAGLGNRFLRHISRTAMLCFVADIAGDPARDCKALESELANSSAADFGEKPKMLALNKTDLLPKAEAEKRTRTMRENFPQFLFVRAVSALTGAGIKELAPLFLQTRDMGGDGDKTVADGNDNGSDNGNRYRYSENKNAAAAK